jgi:hypothetical protein
MPQTEIALRWHGPFVLVPEPGSECVFDHQVATGRGIYLWTIRHGDGYLINYVGETGKGEQTFAVRLADGVRWDLAGKAKGNRRTKEMICDPDLFPQGKRVPIAERFSIKEFLADYSRLSSALYRNYCCCQVFLGPTEVDDTTRKFIEAGIIRTIRASRGEAAAFLSNRRLISPSPSPFRVRMESPVQFHGLNSMVDC